MNATNNFVEVYADSLLGRDGRYFVMYGNDHDEIHQHGIHVEFEQSAFKALIALSDRIEYSPDSDEMDLSEDFTVPQAHDEGLSLLWRIEYYQNHDKYLVSPVDD